MLTLETAGALVPGGVSPRAIEEERKAMRVEKEPALPPTVTVKVVRAFYYQGKPIEKDSVVPLPRVFAFEMRDAKKAIVIEDEPPAAKPAAPAPEEKAETGKEKRNARN